MNEDGLSSLSYIVISAEYNLLYNNLTVDIGEPDPKIYQREPSVLDNLNLTPKLVSKQ